MDKSLMKKDIGFPPDWHIIKQSVSADPSRLEPDDLYLCTCPMCGDPVVIAAAEFFELAGEFGSDIYEIGVWCDSCATGYKKMQDSGE